MKKKENDITNFLCKEKQIKLGNIFILIIILSIGFLFLAKIYGNNLIEQKPYSYINSSISEVPVEEIVSNIKVNQTFIADENKLYGFSIQFATYVRENTSTYQISLINENTNKIVEVWEIAGIEVKDNLYKDFILTNSVDNVKGQAFRIEISSIDATYGNAITIWSSKDDSYTSGKLYINDIVQSGDLSFKVFSIQNDYKYYIYMCINIILITTLLIYFIEKRYFLKLSLYILYNIIFSLFIYLIFNDNANHFYESFTINLKYYYMLIIYISIFFYYGVKEKENIILIIFTIILICLAGVFLDGNYSPIDEAAHLDYINHITDNNKLPTLYNNLDGNTLSLVSETNIPGNVINHEAVQPPLYYLLMSILTFLFENYAVRFIIIRCSGIIILILMLYFCNKSIKILQENNLIKLKSNEYFYFILLFIFNHGILLRFTRISNESLVSLLACVLIYLYIKMIYNGYSKKLWWQCNMLLILIFLTKNTGVFLIGGLLILLIYYKKFYKLIQSLCIFIIGISPWLIYNIKTYSEFTGMKLHLDFVIPIVNPSRQKLDLIPDTLNIFASYINPQEVPKNYLYSIITTFISVSIIVILTIFAIYSINKCILFIKNKLYFNYTEQEKNEVSVILFSALVIANICILFIGSVTTLVNTMIGRYIYISSIPLVCLGIFWVQNKDIYVRKTIYVLLTITLSIGYMALFNIGADTILSKGNYIGSKVTSIEISDITDENWINGVSTDGRIILTDGENRGYSRLISRKVEFSDGQESEIVEIQIHTGYTYLILSSTIDTSQKHNNNLYIE